MPIHGFVRSAGAEGVVGQLRAADWRPAAGCRAADDVPDADAGERRPRHVKSAIAVVGEIEFVETQAAAGEVRAAYGIERDVAVVDDPVGIGAQ